MTTTYETMVDALLECAAAAAVQVQPQRIDLARGVTDPMEAARLLRIPLRPVRLDAGWWRGDSGPYLVECEDGTFAAAVPRSFGYRVGGGPRASTDVTTTAWSVMPSLPSGQVGLRALFRRSLGGGSRVELTVSALVAVLLTIMGIAVPLLSGVVVGRLVPLDSISRIVAIGVLLVLVAVATFGLATMQSLLIQRLTMRLDVRSTAMVLLRVVHLPLVFFRRYGAGELQQRLQGLDDTTGQLAGAVVAIGSALLLALSGLLVMLLVAPVLAAVVVVLLLIMSAIGALAVRSVVRARGDFVAASLALSGLTLSLFTGIAKLRVAGAEGRMLSRWEVVYADRQHAANSAALGSQRVGIVAALTTTMVTLVVVIGSASGLTPLSLGEFTSFVAAAGQTAGAVTGMLVPVTVVLGTLPLVRAIEPILQTPSDQATDDAEPGPLAGEIELAAVSFSYDDVEVLHDVSLHVTPGEFVAIVGPSGSGKSTLVRLLSGLEVPTAGRVLYDGQPLAGLDGESVRRQIGVVVQSAQLATGTLLENITSTRSEDEAWAAAELAGISDDIAAMPMGMLTLVSDGASTFSGGQKQRIMLARALVRRPRIVILDEATSTLDNRNQATVVQSLRRLGATRVVVAHRLSTIVDADRIVVLDAGRVAEEGSYDELVAADGLFTRMVRRQVL